MSTRADIHSKKPPRVPHDLVVVTVLVPNADSASGTDEVRVPVMMSLRATVLDLKYKLIHDYRIAGPPCLWILELLGPEGRSAETTAPKGVTPIAPDGVYVARYVGGKAAIAEPERKKKDFCVSLPQGTRRVLVVDTSVLHDWFIGRCPPRGLPLPDLPADTYVPVCTDFIPA
eukprot:m51a1_g12718 hypothetical protein (173) ;mRNA; f:282-958